MPDFAPNVTPRYRLHYFVAGRAHTIMCRGARGTSAAAMAVIGQNLFNNLWQALDVISFDDLAFVSAEVALTDSDLFFPAALPGAVPGTQPIATASKQDSITHLTFSGRGNFGSKVTYHVYGVALNPDVLPATSQSDFVLLSSEDANISAAVAALNLAGNNIVTVDNTKPTFSARATIKINDFWLRRVRQGL